MAEIFQAVRGMNDVLPQEVLKWQYLEEKYKEILSQYAYKEIKLPIIESTNLFKRSIGDMTDIVTKEMYTFTDLNGDSITLRPEGTASCIRASLEHGLLYNQTQKLWYQGPMFRHEKPQKGRYRQFYQLGVEAFGFENIAIELELLALCKRLWEELGISEHIYLEINNLGRLNNRLDYQKALSEYFSSYIKDLDDDSKARLYSNPLRILDSKNPSMQDIINAAPSLDGFLPSPQKQEFERLCESLTAMGIKYEINPKLVRGLDYYENTVFEWKTKLLGAQATVCAGGRYDILVEQLGGKPTYAVGFALGLERLILLLDKVGTNFNNIDPDIYFIAENQECLYKALTIAENLRDYNKTWSIIVDLQLGNFKNQFKRADKKSAKLACIIGNNELQDSTVAIKNLKNHDKQVIVAQNTCANYIESILK